MWNNISFLIYLSLGTLADFDLKSQKNKGKTFLFMNVISIE